MWRAVLQVGFLGLVAALSAAACLSGCATTKRYEAKLHTWIGHDQDPLIQSWGSPDATEKMSNGDSMLVYARLKRYPLAFNEPVRSEKNLYLKCATYFEIDAHGKIVATTIVGEDCTKIE